MSKPAPALYCSFCGRPRAEVTALVVAPSVAICDICTMAAFLSLDEGQRRHALRCLHGQGHGVTVVTPQATDEAVAALLANNRNVSYAEIDLNFGHDSFLMDDAHYHGVVDAYLRNIKL
jgi:hypothetical protein